MKSAKQYKIDTYLRIANASTDDFTREDAVKKALDLLENRAFLKDLDSEDDTTALLDLFLEENYVVTHNSKDKISKFEFEHGFFTWCVKNELFAPDKKDIQGMLFRLGILLKKQSNFYYLGLAKTTEVSEVLGDENDR